MRVLLDECIPRKVKRQLADHEVKTVPEAGWAGIKNGSLLRLAESSFDVFVTVDKNLAHQNDLSALDLAVVVLDALDNKIATLEPLVARAADAIKDLRPGQIVRIGTGAELPTG